MSEVGDRFEAVAAAVRAAECDAGREPGSVGLVAVSKRQPARALAEAFEAGARDFGESYVQEMVAKREALRQLLGSAADAVRWHFIGHLQRNKVRDLGRVHLVHTVDSVRLLDALDARGTGVEGVLVQVNIGGESTKGGVEPEALAALLVATAGQQTPIKGLMAIPPPRESVADSRGDFAQLRTLRDQVRTPTLPLRELSMGMSSDFAAAVAEGATLVRVGTAIFGART